MNNENNNELVNAINKLANVIRGGVLIIGGTIMEHGAWVAPRPDSGFLSIIAVLLTTAIFLISIWVGFKLISS